VSMHIIRKARLGLAVPVVVAAVSVAGCGSNSNSSSSGSSTPAGGTAPTAAKAPTVAYSGAESTLPTSVAAPQPSTGKSLKIGWIPPTNQVPALASIQTIMQNQIKKLGGTLLVKDPQLAPDKQVSLFNELLSQGVDAIVIYPIIPDVLAPSLKKAADKGVKVISLDTPPDASKPPLAGYAMDISLGRDQSAYGLAKDLAAEKPGGSFGILGLAAPIPSLNYTADREKYWAGKMGLKYVSTSGAKDASSSSAATAMSGLLGRSPNLDGVFAYNDVGALAGIGTARSGGKNGIAFVGINGSKAAADAVKGGSYLATAKENWECVGKNGINAAYNLVTKQNLPLPKRILCASTVIDKSNVNSITPNA